MVIAQTPNGNYRDFYLLVRLSNSREPPKNLWVHTPVYIYEYQPETHKINITTQLIVNSKRYTNFEIAQFTPFVQDFVTLARVSYFRQIDAQLAAHRIQRLMYAFVPVDLTFPKKGIVRIEFAFSSFHPSVNVVFQFCLEAIIMHCFDQCGFKFIGFYVGSNH